MIVHHRARALFPVLVLFLLSGPGAGEVRAHNGEYVPPALTRPRPPVGPGTGTPPPTRSGVPEVRPPRPGTATGPSVARPGSGRPGVTPGPSGGEGPGEISRENALDFESVWVVLGDGFPAPPPPLPESTRRRLVEALGAALADESEEVRSWAGLALGRGGEVAAVASRLEVDPDLRSSIAMLGLGPAVRRARAAGDEEGAKWVRATILRSLAGDAAPPVEKALAALAAGFAGPELAGPLLGALGREEHGDLKTVLLYALGATGHPGAPEFLLPAIRPPGKLSPEEDDPVRRALLVSAAAGAGDAQVRTELIRRLGDPSPRVAAAAALALRNDVARPDVSGALRAVAGSGSPLPRSAALLALTLEGDPEAARLARAATRDPLGRDNGLAAFGAFCLGLRRSATDGEALLAGLGDDDLPEDVRAACAVAVGLTGARDGAEALRRLLPDLRSPRVRAYALFSLALLAGEEAVEAIGDELSRREAPGVRRILVDALGRTGGGSAVEPLISALGDSYTVNRRAAAALFRIDPERAAEAVIGRLTDAENLFARRFGAIVIGRALDPETPTAFGAALLSGAFEVRSPVLSVFAFLEAEGIDLR